MNAQSRFGGKRAKSSLDDNSEKLDNRLVRQRNLPSSQTTTYNTTNCGGNTVERRIITMNAQLVTTTSSRQQSSMTSSQSQHLQSGTAGFSSADRGNMESRLLSGFSDSFRNFDLRGTNFQGSNALQGALHNPSLLGQNALEPAPGFDKMFNDSMMKYRNELISTFPTLKEQREETTLFISSSESHSETVTGDGMTMNRQVQRNKQFYHHQSTSSNTNGVRSRTLPQWSGFVTRVVFIRDNGPEGFTRQIEQFNPADEDTLSETDESESQSQFSSSEVESDADGKQSKIKNEIEPLEKAICVLNEIVGNDHHYLDILSFLIELRTKLESKLTADKIGVIFRNVSTLYDFHTIMHQEMQGRLKEWPTTQKFADIFTKRADFLKIYTVYCGSANEATKLYNELLKKDKNFGMIIEKLIESYRWKNPKDAKLNMDAHFTKPNQVLMQYHLLLDRYHRSLPAGHSEIKETESAIKITKSSVKFVNDHSEIMTRCAEVMEIQKELGNSVTLLAPSRKLIRRNIKVTKLSARTDEHEPRELILFNDLLLLCTVNKIGRSKVKIQTSLSVEGLQVIQGDNLTTENSWYLRGRHANLGQDSKLYTAWKSANNDMKRVELYSSSPKEKESLQKLIFDTIRANEDRITSFSTTRNLENSGVASGSPVKSCSSCQLPFSAIRKDCVCESCGERVCAFCVNNEISVSRGEKPIKVCKKCHIAINERQENGSKLRNLLKSKPQSSQAVGNCNQKRMKSMKASHNAILAGYLNLKTGNDKSWMNRYLSIQDDFILYTFKSKGDRYPKTALPLTGCDLEPIELTTKDKFVIKLTHSNKKRVHLLQASDQELFTKWFAALELAAKAKVEP